LAVARELILLVNAPKNRLSGNINTEYTVGKLWQIQFLAMFFFNECRNFSGNT